MTEASDKPLLSFPSHIHGKNATVQIYPDRIEWDHKGDRSKLTMGMTRKRGSHETIAARQITSVRSTRSGMLNTAVTVRTAGGDVEFRVSKGDADAVLAAIREISV
jgi:hypothetical protein